MLDWFDQNGIRRRETMPAGTTLKAAKEKLRKYEDQAGKGEYIPASEQKLFENVVDSWLELKKGNVRESTFYIIELQVKNHFSRFNGIPINKISTESIEKWISDIRKTGLKISTVRIILMNFGQVFKYAVRHKYLNANPVLSIERPKPQGDIDSFREMKILKPDEIVRLLEVTTNQKYHCLFMLAIFSGARQGELLGLKWSDILWDIGQIEIKRSYSSRKFYEPKTPASRRKIDIGNQMTLELKKWKVACPPNDFDLVFPTNNGTPMNSSNMKSDAFFPALKRANIQGIRFHDLRHTYASLKIHQGVNIKYLQKQLGHNKATTTLDVYSHLLQENNSESANDLENMVLK
jgi:integrase